MTRQWKKTFIATAIVGLFTAVSFAAPLQVTADVPFSFTAGKAILPAGRYAFLLQDPMGGSELRIRTMDHANAGRTVAVLLTESRGEARPVDQSKLIFDQYGNDHFLAQVLVAGYDEAHVVSERVIRREQAMVALHERIPVPAK